jgi:hypothetical protein
MNSPVRQNEFWQKAQQSIVAVQAPWQKYLGEIQRVSKQFEQLASISKLFEIPTDAEWKTLYEVRKEAALLLARRGWFIPLDMTLGEIKALFQKIEMGKEDEVELLVETRLEAGLVGIQAELVSHFPDLAPMLNEAFELHHDGKYFGSVALFLSLSDGIGQRIFQASPLSRKKLKGIEEWVRSRQNEDPLFGWFWAAISEVLPINDNTTNLRSYVDPLNRHAVLHGLVSDHGTKRHSLKAVSWLEYISQFRELALAPVSQSRLIDRRESTTKSEQTGRKKPRRS